MIRRAKRGTARRDLRLAEAVFWLMLVLAVAVGGGRVIAGLPVLFDAFMPSGLIAARADVQTPSHLVTFPLRLPGHGRAYAPQVLTPESARTSPGWFVPRARYAGPASVAGAPLAASARRPAIAIVLDDLGLDVIDTRRAIALPKAITLSFLPYGHRTPALARLGEQAGHQVIVHVPMEPEGAQRPGPMALRVDLSAGENLQRLDWDLSRVPGYAGINNHMGSRFSTDRAGLVPVMERLAGHDVFFLDSRTTAQTVIVPLARAFGVPSAGRDVFLDDTRTPDYIDAQLAKAEHIARERGVAIAIGHPHPVTLAALKAWCANLTARGYRLIPVGEAIRLKTERAAGKIALRGVRPEFDGAAR